MGVQTINQEKFAHDLFKNINMPVAKIIDKGNIEQDHLRMDNSNRSNNHLRSIDLFRSMII